MLGQRKKTTPQLAKGVMLRFNDCTPDLRSKICEKVDKNLAIRSGTPDSVGGWLRFAFKRNVSLDDQKRTLQEVRDFVSSLSSGSRSRLAEVGMYY